MSHRSLPCRAAGGFTLVEVLVALFIVAVGMGALMAALTSAADSASRLREKSFGEWVALNHISETRLRGQPPAVGSTEGDVDFAGSKWHWKQEVADPGIAGIRRIDVAVSHATQDGKQGDKIAEATGFIGLAVGQPSGIDPDWSLWSSSGSSSSSSASSSSTSSSSSSSSSSSASSSSSTSATTSGEAAK